jgi:hypothetical protein
MICQPEHCHQKFLLTVLSLLYVSTFLQSAALALWHQS